MTAHAWPAAFREPIHVPADLRDAARGIDWPGPHREQPAPIQVTGYRGQATPPAGLPHLEDVRPAYRDDPWATAPSAAPSTATQPRPYLDVLDEQRAPRTRRDPLPRELDHPGHAHRPAAAPEFRSTLAALAAPDAAYRLGHTRGVAGRMHHELEAHGRRALAVVQDPRADEPARAAADAQLAAWRTGILAVEAILAAVAGAPTAACDLPPDLRAP